MFFINNTDPETTNGIWQSIMSFFDMIRDNINNFIRSIWSIDDFLLGLYYDHVAPLDELVKFGLLILTAIIVVLGVISLIKKSIKLVIILGLIVIVIVFLNRI